MKTKKTSKTVNTISPSHIPALPNVAITESLRQTLKVKTEGEKSTFDALSRTADFLLANYPSFCFSDFLKSSKAYDLSYETCQDFFEKFTKHFTQHGKLSPVVGAYGKDEPIYIVTS